jgi:hypothetical protein
LKRTGLQIYEKSRNSSMKLRDCLSIT